MRSRIPERLPSCAADLSGGARCALAGEGVAFALDRAVLKREQSVCVRLLGHEVFGRFGAGSIERTTNRVDAAQYGAARNSRLSKT